MSNGGYKGASPARETSPEQYPGVWELTEQFQAQADGNWPFQETDCAPKSLRFNEGDVSNLTKTFASAGNRRVFTWNFWVKPATQSENNIAVVGSGSPNSIRFNANGTFQIKACGGSLTTSAVFRDFSAWYGITVAVNSTAPVASDRIKLFVNGQDFTSDLTGTSATLNGVADWNTAATHYIGKQQHNNSNMLDGLLSEVTFIDGQALSCEEFGFFDGQGIWQPKRFTGDYSNGPVYSNFSAANGVVASGSLSNLFDSSTSTYVQLSQSTTNYAIATQEQAIPVSSSIGMWTLTGASNPTLRITETNGTVTVLDYNDATIQNDAWTDFTFTGTIAKIEVGYIAGSGSSNNFYGLRVDGIPLIDASVGRNSFHLDFSDGAKDQSGLGNDWTGNNINFYSPNQSQIWTNSVTGGASSYGAKANAFDGDLTTYASPEHSSPMLYTNPSASDTVIDTFEVFTNIYSTTGITGELNGTSIVSQLSTTTQWHTITGFKGQNFSTFKWNANSSNHELRVYAIRINGRILLDSNVVVPSYLAPDLFVDSPVNGNEASTGAGGERRGCYATLNPLNSTASTTLSNGNLAMNAGGGWGSCMSTVGFTGGKFYYETTVNASNYSYIGVSLATHLPNRYPSQDGSWALLNNGYCYYDQTGSNAITVNTGTSVPAGAVVGTAIDADNGKIWWSVNGSWIGSGSPNPATGADAIFTNIPTDQTLVACLDVYSNSATVNFGQLSFSYAAPAGFSPLATSFLPEPAIKRCDEAMDVVDYVGNASVNKIENLRMSPDLVWVKNYSNSTGYHHGWFDTVRGANKVIQSSTQSNETTYTQQLTAFTDDGFELGTNSDSGNYVNLNGDDYYAWVWDAGETTTTIAAGGLNSSVYDQSATWSTSGTMSGFSTSGTYDFAHLFNGVLGADTPGTANQMTSPSGGSGTWTYTINNVTEFKIRLYVPGSTHATANSIKINGSDIVQAQILDKGLSNDAWHTVTVPGITTFTSLFVEDNYWYVSNIYINGKELVDSGVTVTNVPSIATTVRARPEAGFSIAKYQGNGSTSGPSIAHNLGTEPAFVLIKNLDGSQSYPDWYVKHKDIGDNYNTRFNLTAGRELATGSGSWYQGGIGNLDSKYALNFVTGAQTSTGNVNTNGVNYIAYCWAEVEGLSKFGKYTARSAPNFIYCGFAPALVICKSITSGTSESWLMTTWKSQNQNSFGKYLATNGADYERSTAGYMDLVSNGFVHRHDQGWNNYVGGGYDYIFMAWATDPFASNNRAR
tara:strand:+ start:3952 stop:7731 length:3780 start_codon:yes stop_codon:yes gene_type:complete